MSEILVLLARAKTSLRRTQYLMPRDIYPASTATITINFVTF